MMNHLQQSFFMNKEQTLGVTLNDIQKKAVMQTEGPMLLLASPGSGKTTTIIMRIGYMMEVLRIHPSRIKAVTFSKASANDMKARFHKFFPHLTPVHFSTIHSLAYEVVRNKLQMDGTSFVLLEETDQGTGLSKKRILREIFERLNKTKITEDQLEELLTYISYVKNKMLPEYEWAQVDIKVPKKVEILKSYEEFKKMGTDQLLIDFDDMLILANEIFAKHPEILYAYQARYDYFLTDESQDTSSIQHAIIKKLVAKHQNLCVVADEDQAIYSWRGADVDYLLNFKQIYPNAIVLMMTQNYRSTANIVSAANQFIKRNKKRYDKTMTTDKVEGEPIRFTVLPNYDLQANYLIAELNEPNFGGSTVILYRNNNAAIPLLDAFEREGIPFTMKDSTMRFFKHWVVEDVMNFMRLAYNTKNSATFEKIFRKFNAYITPTQMNQLKTLPIDSCVFTTLLEQVELKEYQPEYLKRIRRAYQLVDFEKTTPTEMLSIIRKDFGYEKSLKNLSESFGFNYQNLIDVLEVLTMIAKNTSTLTEFANRLKQLEQIASNANRNRSNITLATLHSCKGLEFDRVYIIDCVEGILPNVDEKVLGDPKVEAELEEETRLFYVGITRAIKQLTCISYKKRFHQPVVESRFMRALHHIVEPPVKRERQLMTKPKKELKQYRNEQTITSHTELNVGDTILHVVFGEGEILSLDKGMIELAFQSGIKKFVIDMCIQQGYLEHI